MAKFNSSLQLLPTLSAVPTAFAQDVTKVMGTLVTFAASQMTSAFCSLETYRESR